MLFALTSAIHSSLSLERESPKHDERLPNRRLTLAVLSCYGGHQFVNVKATRRSLSAIREAAPDAKEPPMILHFEVLWGRHGQGRACRASALLASILVAPVAAQLPKSPFIPVSVESCLIADSLLGPLTEQGAVVRAYYVAKVDSTRLVAGPERGSPIYAGKSRPMISVSTSYSGHKLTAYPH